MVELEEMATYETKFPANVHIASTLRVGHSLHVVGSITAGAFGIAANTITAAEIAANTITAAEIAANTITAAEIAANTITAAEIAANTITAAEIAAGAIGTSELGAIAGNGLGGGSGSAVAVGVVNRSGVVVSADSIALGFAVGAVGQTSAGSVDLAGSLEHHFAYTMSTGDYTFQLPDAADFLGQQIWAIITNSSGGVVTVTAQAGDTISAAGLSTIPDGETRALSYFASSASAWIRIGGEHPASASASAGTGLVAEGPAIGIAPQGVGATQLTDGGVTAVKLNFDVAGAGLTSTAGVLAVGAGTALTVAADTIGVTAGGIDTTQLADGGVTAVKLNFDVAGAGLTSTAGVLAVGAGTALTVAADTIGVTAGGIDTTQLADGGVTAVKLNFDVAGAGLTSTAGVLAVGAGTALTVAAHTIGVTAGGIGAAQLGDGGVTAVKLNFDVAGAGLTSTAGVLAVGAGTALTVAADTIGVTAGGIGATQLADGAVTAAKIETGTAADDTIRIGTHLQLDGTTTAAGVKYVASVGGADLGFLHYARGTGNTTVLAGNGTSRGATNSVVINVGTRGRTKMLEVTTTGVQFKADVLASITVPITIDPGVSTVWIIGGATADFDVNLPAAGLGQILMIRNESPWTITITNAAYARTIPPITGMIFASTSTDWFRMV